MVELTLAFLLQWYPEVLHFCPTTPLILVGLKSDLRSKRTCIDLLKTQGLTPVTPEQGRAVAARMGATYIECSSKEMQGVDQVFDLAVDKAIEAEENSWGGQPQSHPHAPQQQQQHQHQHQYQQRNNKNPNSQKGTTDIGGYGGDGDGGSSSGSRFGKSAMKVRKRTCKFL